MDKIEKQILEVLRSPGNKFHTLCHENIGGHSNNWSHSGIHLNILNHSHLKNNLNKNNEGGVVAPTSAKYATSSSSEC